MGKVVVSGAKIECTFGTEKGTVNAIPKFVNADSSSMLNILDYAPGVNLMPPVGLFTKCKSMLNPTTIAATAANYGVFQAGLCTPVIPAPWSPGNSVVNVRGIPAVDEDCNLYCVFAGVVSISKPGQKKVKYK